jgi:hypothetical protein
MSTRKSPAESATLYAIGTKKTGLDGNKWIITETKTGVKRWKMFRNQTYRNEKKVEKQKKTKEESESDENEIEEKSLKKMKKEKKSKEKFQRYLIHDNGARPFSVHVSKATVSVFKCFHENDLDKCSQEQEILTFKKPIKVWIGIEPSVPSWNGNSIIVQINRSDYVYIGNMIFQFQLADKGEKVEKYMSIVGNSDVPYPYLITNKNIYFMVDDCYASRKYYDDQDLYFDEPYQKHYTRDQTDYKTHPFKNKKMLQESLF